MTKQDLRNDFHNEQAEKWIYNNGYINISYVEWLENTLLTIKNCNISHVVEKSKQLESGLTCMMCRKPKKNDGHTCCEDCAGLPF